MLLSMSFAVTEEREQAYYFQMALQPSCSRLIQNSGHSDQGLRVTGRIDVHLMRQGSLFMALFIFSSDVLSTWEVFQMNKEAALGLGASDLCGRISLSH